MVAAFDTTNIVRLANKFFALSTLEVHVIGQNHRLLCGTYVFLEKPFLADLSLYLFDLKLFRFSILIYWRLFPLRNKRLCRILIFCYEEPESSFY